ncbi:50S ribosomal protein L13 [bacterium]|jgi:large subunit ribosomal protein L13|nr:50S ribosomal protein L13 [bacterium]MBT4122290.1 50S ribosomal protein L13 [bacterium]MBT4335683.1 50S ribosomal protein L13 [bacterium]MBT4495743.1 50S ribosomal protein L13 [bacterium]MBT4764145.1 50S ribosomal protein L13 [bacterium]
MNNEITREKHQLDATDKIGGRLATEVAILLMGKHKVIFERHLDQGDFVEILNITKLKFSGNKLKQKSIYHHTGYPGGIKEIKLGKKFESKPEEVFKKMVYNMLPKNKLRKEIIKRLTFKSDTNIKQD